MRTTDPAEVLLPSLHVVCQQVHRHPPALRRGDRTYRHLPCAVVPWAAAAAPACWWTRRSLRRPARVGRRHQAFLFGVGVDAVWNWRKALAVKRMANIVSDRSKELLVGVPRPVNGIVIHPHRERMASDTLSVYDFLACGAGCVAPPEKRHVCTRLAMWSGSYGAESGAEPAAVRRLIASWIAPARMLHFFPRHAAHTPSFR